MRIVIPSELCVVYAFADTYVEFDTQIDHVCEWSVSYGEDLQLVAKLGDGFRSCDYW